MQLQVQTAPDGTKHMFIFLSCIRICAGDHDTLLIFMRLHCDFQGKKGKGVVRFGEVDRIDIDE